MYSSTVELSAYSDQNHFLSWQFVREPVPSANASLGQYLVTGSHCPFSLPPLLNPLCWAYASKYIFGAVGITIRWCHAIFFVSMKLLNSLQQAQHFPLWFEAPGFNLTHWTANMLRFTVQCKSPPISTSKKNVNGRGRCSRKNDAWNFVEVWHMSHRRS